MVKDIAKVIMNPIRQRIIQYLSVNGESNTKSIGEELNDIPTPTLYRHIKVLLEAEVIRVVEEDKVRGAVQKTYAMNSEMISDTDNESANAIIQNSLYSLGAAFQAYFAKENADTKKDLLSFTTSTLLLSDEECVEFFNQINSIVMKFVANQPNEERKVRRITLISSPCEEG